jgi:hypothetical protein
MAEAPCGCRVEITEEDGGTLHVWPCSPEHEPAMTAVARDAADRAGMEYVEDAD